MLKEGEALQPATMMFRFGPIDHARFDALPKAEVAALATRGYESGDLARAALHSSRDPFSSDAWFNISRIGVDATDAFLNISLERLMQALVSLDQRVVITVKPARRAHAAGITIAA